MDSTRKLSVRGKRPDSPPLVGRSRAPGAGGRRQTDAERIAEEALAIEREAAREAGELAFYARILTQCSLPHSRPETNTFERTNGLITVSLWAPSAVGLPYGRVPRLLCAWLTTAAIRSSSPTLRLGESLSAFMREVGIAHVSGGKWGSVRRVRDQVTRLFSTSIRATLQEDGHFETRDFAVAARAALWWTPARPEEISLFGSYVQLGDEFYRSILDRPIPVDKRALKVLRAPMALDVYTWASWRASFLRAPVLIPWELLSRQFGSSYAEPRQFRFNFLRAARTVAKIYPGMRLAQGEGGLLISPAKPHVPMLRS